MVHNVAEVSIKPIDLARLGLENENEELAVALRSKIDGFVRAHLVDKTPQQLQQSLRYRCTHFECICIKFCPPPHLDMTNRKCPENWVVGCQGFEVTILPSYGLLTSNVLLFTVLLCFAWRHRRQKLNATTMI